MPRVTERQRFIDKLYYDAAKKMIQVSSPTEVEEIELELNFDILRVRFNSQITVHNKLSIISNTRWVLILHCMFKDVSSFQPSTKTATLGV